MSDRDLEKILGPLEAEVLRALWAAEGPISVRDVLERLNEGRSKPYAYTTIMTVLSRLAEKGILSRRRRGRGYVYEAAVRDPAEIAVRDVLRDFGETAVAHFVEEARADPELLARLQRLLDDEG